MAGETKVPHYLPAAAYLRFFEDPRRPNFIWMYQRGLDPRRLPIMEVAKERNLWPPDIERVLTEIEDAARPILNRLNSNSPPDYLTAAEEYAIGAFAACLAVRVPGQRRVVQEMSGALSKLELQFNVLSPSFPAKVAAAKQGGKLPQSFHVTRAREIALSDKYKFLLKENPAMLLAIDTAPDLVPTFLMKRLYVVRSAPEESFITSDYPVLLVGDAEIPPLYGGGGFFMSSVLLPIGRHSMLAWIPDDNKEPPQRPDTLVAIMPRTISSDQVRRVGKSVLSNAERFVFGPERNVRLKALFDRTARPERFRIYSPFSDT